MSKIEQKIPEGWSVKKLKDVANVITGSTPSTSDLTNYGTEYLFVSPVDIKDNVKFINNTVTKLSFKGHSLGRVVSAGSPLFVCIGSTIGKIAIAGQTLTTNQQINSCIVNNQNDNEFLYYVLLFNANKIRLLAGEQAVPIINKSTFEKISFIFPPLPEQEKIAEILGTWDDGIEKLSASIEKKKLLKKGLMQKLLTGKNRLNGFTQPWKEVKLGDMCKMFSGGTPLVSEEKYYKNGNIPFIRSGEISSFKTELFITEKALENSSAKMIEKGDLLYALYGATSGEIAISKINGAINQAILCIRSTKIEISYLYYVLLNSKSIILSKYLQGGQGNLSADIVKKLSIKMPSDINEQKAIADVLSTADEEIDLLNKKLKALKEQKKGLMQQLLTGQTRVKVN